VLASIVFHFPLIATGEGDGDASSVVWKNFRKITELEALETPLERLLALFRAPSPATLDLFLIYTAQFLLHSRYTFSVA